MSREAFGDPPESQEPLQVCPVCGGTEHAEGCELGEEVALRLKAERDSHRMQFALHRLWPALERQKAALKQAAEAAVKEHGELLKAAGIALPNARLTGPKRPLQEYANGTD